MVERMTVRVKRSEVLAAAGFYAKLFGGSAIATAGKGQVSVMLDGRNGRYEILVVAKKLFGPDNTGRKIWVSVMRKKQYDWKKATLLEEGAELRYEHAFLGVRDRYGVDWEISYDPTGCGIILY